VAEDFFYCGPAIQRNSAAERVPVRLATRALSVVSLLDTHSRTRFYHRLVGTSRGASSSCTRTQTKRYSTCLLRADIKLLHSRFQGH